MVPDFLFQKIERKMSRYWKCIKSPIGDLKIETNDESLISVFFDPGSITDSEFQPEILAEACKQLNEYFAGKRQKFHLQLAPEGTPFQKQVWSQVSQVSYGKRASYSEIARYVATEKHTRAVGLANEQNPLPIIIPCHRIVGANRKLTGYAGGIVRKKWLLQHEWKHTIYEDELF